MNAAANAELTHRAAREYFPALIDQELDQAEEARVRAHLTVCLECRDGWEKYERAMDRIRGTPRLTAPDALATVLLRRAKKKGRFGLKAIAKAHDDYRVPYEIIIPVILGAVVAALIVMLG